MWEQGALYAISNKEASFSHKKHLAVFLDVLEGKEEEFWLNIADRALSKLSLSRSS